LVSKKYILFLVSAFNILTVDIFAHEQISNEKVVLQLDWKHQFEYAGYYIAKEKGFYNQVGLNVEIKEFNGTDPVSATLSGSANYGSYNSKIILAKMRGEQIVLLANILKKSALVFITQENIKTPIDFINKKIMATQDQLKNDGIGILIKRFNIENKYTQVEPSFLLTSFYDNQINIMSGYISNEPFELYKNKINFNIIDPANYGIYMYGDSIFTTISEVEKNPERVSNFVSASINGWKYALENIDETINIILEKYNSQNKSYEALKFEADEIKRLIMADIYNLGSIDKEKIKNIADSFVEIGLAEKNYSLKNLLFEDLKNSAIKLSSQEQLYLNNKKSITVCANINNMPYEINENNIYKGMVSEYLNILSALLDVKLEIKFFENSLKSIEALKNNECDITSQYNNHEKAENLYISEPSFNFSLVAVSKIEKPFVSQIEQIANEKIAIVKGEYFKDILIQDYKISGNIEVDNINSGLEAVLSENATYFVDALPSIGYFLQKNYYSQLKIAGKFHDNFQIKFLTNDQKLQVILNKVIRAIPESESTRIVNNWISIKYDEFDKSIFIKLSIIFIIIIIIIYLKYILTERYNKKLKEDVQRQLEEIRKKDSALLNQNKLASMGEMIGSIAHQWKQPLNILQLNIEMLIDDYQDNLIDENFINNFRDKNIDIIKFMVITIDDFRNFFRVEKEKTLFDVKNAISKIVEMQKIYLKKRYIEVEVIGTSFKAFGFATEFQQVILNLVNNAKDEMIKQKMTNGRIKIYVSEDGLIKVIDNAGGVPENIIDQIFEPYFTTKGVGEGTGLGLHMSRTIVEEHLEGTIGVKNIDGGAEFFVKLPPIKNS
jgi:signal transduction histidine kinase/ABC-type nitrate/sulfonate/bicarbonate transport system substrate-binding protein